MRIQMFLLLILLSSRLTAQDSYDKYIWFANVGQSIPIGSIRADKNSDSPLEIIRRGDFAKSYRIGFEFYPFKQLGLSVGFSIMNFKLDKAVFESMHNPDNTLTESYLENYNDYYKIHTGLTSRFAVKRISIEPKFTLGIITHNYHDAEFYLKSSTGEIYKTITYDISAKDENTFIWLCYNGALNLACDVYHKKDGFSVGLQFFSELTFMNPMVRQITTESNKNTDNIISTDKVYRQPATFFYYGVGLYVKY